MAGGDEFWCTCTAGVHPHSERLWVSNQGENKTDAWHNPERKTDKGLLACLGKKMSAVQKMPLRYRQLQEHRVQH